MGSCRMVSCMDFVPCAITCPGLQTTGGPSRSSGDTPLMDPWIPEGHVGMLQAFETLAVIPSFLRVHLLSPSRSASLQVFACHAALVGFVRPRGQLQHRYPSSDLQSSLAVCMLLSKASPVTFSASYFACPVI